jgi:hypothetical protein
MTCPITHNELYRWRRKYVFESQAETYTCGPVAIMNALHFEQRYSDLGPAIKRQIMVACNAKEVHEDGFAGTKPMAIDGGIRKYWPKATKVEGGVRAEEALKSRGSILLYRRANSLLHYIFVHFDGKYYHLENEVESGSLSVENMKSYTYECIYQGFNIPQVWSLY